jgi:ABC-2 type transport system ATP-binding protein
MENVIEVRGLTKKFGGREVLRGIDFAIERGTVFGVIGPNGAGKTTTMRCLLDIIRPSGGSVRVLGEDPRRAGPGIRRRIGYLPGELALESRVSGRTMLEHFAAISGPVPAGRIDALAERLGMDLDKQTRRLSKGNKQKLGLIQAFMHEPELLVLDEPTSGLDPLMQQEFLALVREARGRGQTVFLSSHVISEIQQAADEVAILRDGRIATISTVPALRDTAVSHLRVVTGLGEQRLREVLGGLAGLRDLRITAVHDAGGSPAHEATGRWEGPVGPLVEALPALAPLDLALEEPDLEEAVLKLYREPEATPETPAGLREVAR